MSFLVDNPILNSPFDEPIRYWAYEEGRPIIAEGRRPDHHRRRQALPGDRR